MTLETPFLVDAVRSPSGRIKAGGAFTIPPSCLRRFSNSW
jgi:hypothetical protein